MRPPGFFLVSAIHFCRSDWPLEQPAAHKAARTAQMTPALAMVFTWHLPPSSWPSARPRPRCSGRSWRSRPWSDCRTRSSSPAAKSGCLAAWRCGDPAHEVAEVVIRAHQLDFDRQLGIEAVALLAARLEQLLLQAGGETGLRNVDQKIRHLGLARQLPQHGAEAALHFRELRLVGFEVGGALLLVLELRAQVELVRLRLQQDGTIVVPHEHVPGDGRDAGEYQCDEEAAHGQRPAADVARIESTELIEKLHFAATFLTVVWPPFSRSTPTTSLVRVKFDPPVGESLADSTTTSTGLSIHTDESMLRMNVDTRVLD